MGELITPPHYRSIFITLFTETLPAAPPENKKRFAQSVAGISGSSRVPASGDPGVYRLIGLDWAIFCCPLRGWRGPQNTPPACVPALGWLLRAPSPCARQWAGVQPRGAPWCGTAEGGHKWGLPKTGDGAQALVLHLLKALLTDMSLSHPWGCPQAELTLAADHRLMPRMAP